MKARFSGVSLTAKLIIFNVAIFILAFIISFFIPGFFDLLALKPIDFIHGKNLWTLVTSMFMHASFFHLFVNMFSLWFVGMFLERIIGRKRFLIFYIISGLIAGLIFALLSGFFGFGFFARIFGDQNIAGVGASGAIFGLIGLLACLVPRSKVYLIGGPLIAIVLQAIIEVFITNSIILNLISLIISVYIFVSIFALFSFNLRTRKIALPIEMPLWLLPIVAIIPLVVIGIFVPLPIGNMAHLGGLIAGLFYGFYLRRKYRKKIKLLGKMFR